MVNIVFESFSYFSIFLLLFDLKKKGVDVIKSFLHFKAIHCTLVQFYFVIFNGFYLSQLCQFKIAHR